MLFSCLDYRLVVDYGSSLTVGQDYRMEWTDFHGIRRMSFHEFAAQNHEALCKMHFSMFETCSFILHHVTVAGNMLCHFSQQNLTDQLQSPLAKRDHSAATAHLKSIYTQWWITHPLSQGI
jgi:hypothetical protein